jgi:preprotein translocase subunit SecA
MAGRGTDIVLGEGVPALGGLHVIGTERHESRRIDNQLRGRCARQGDPGSTQFFVSLDDDLMRIFGSDRVGQIMETLGLPEDQPIQHGMISKSLESAQRKVEGHNFDIRKHLVEYDDVMNKQRAYIYKLRYRVLSKENLKDDYLEILERAATNLVAINTHAETGEIILEDLAKELMGYTGQTVKLDPKLAQRPSQEVVEGSVNVLKEIYNDKEKRITSEMMRVLERVIYLRTIDMLWIDHLDAMDHLREGIGLRGYGQKDPLIEYKNESYRMFKTLLGAIENEILGLIYKAEITKNAEQPSKKTAIAKEAENQNIKRQVSGHKKSIGRNDPCPCGSGKKYKKCCGQ